MTRWMGRATLVATLALGLTACGQSSGFSGGPGTTSGTVSLAGPTVTGRPGSPNDSFHSLLAHSRDLGEISPTAKVAFLVLLKDPLAAQRAAVLAAMYRPGSPTFGKYETVKDLEKYGPPVGRVERARQVLRHAGLSSSWQRGDTWMTISGPARTVERTFHVAVHNYGAPTGKHFYASAKDPTMPAGLRAAVSGSAHISSYVNVHTGIGALRSRLHGVPHGGLSPTGLRQVYDMAQLADNLHLDGSGQTVAFVEVDGFDPADLTAYTSRFSLPPMNPTIKFGPTLKPGDETEMDLQVVHAIAPKANLTIYNCPGNCTDTDLIAAVNHAVHDTPHGIISISLGGCEIDDNTAQIQAMNSPFEQADALGESVFISSGDSGAFTCLTDNWGAAPTSKYVGASSPATAPGATSVGGTRVSINRDGSWYREEVWENPAETAGSGGGPSAFVTRPSWQTGRGVDLNGKRQTPDVSADADPQTGATIKFVEGWFEGGGTSQAAPIWAGMTALMNQYFTQKALRPAGFLNPALYALANGSPAFPPFHDVTLGSNFVFSAGPGYDMASGLGTPDAWNLLRDLETYIRTGKAS